MAGGWFRRRRDPEPIAEAHWQRAADALATGVSLTPAQWRRLRTLATGFLGEKTFSGAQGFTVTEEVRIAIAAQACLPVLTLGLGAYRDFLEIVVYPAQFRVPRREVDEAGVVHESLEWLAGEAHDGGPVVLSWADADPAATQGPFNVVIHEFVHKLDLLDGEADGIPPLPPGRRAAWTRALHAAHTDFCDLLDALERAIPRDIDPESEAADPWYAQLPLDPYAATDPAEFFAVSGEAFFLDPESLRARWPDWYAQLASLFRLDAVDESALTEE